LTRIESGLTVASALLQRWNSGEVPVSAEVEAAGALLRVMHAALITARELCAGGNAVPVAPSASPNLLHRCLEN